MGEHIKVSGGNNSYKMKKPWRGDNNNESDDEELQDPEVYFASTVLTNKLDTLELVNRVCASWGMIGGNKLWPKKISYFKTGTPVVMYHMLNLGHHTTILSKIRPILIEARDQADAEEWGYKDTGRAIPKMGIHISVPKIHGQDTTVFSSWPSFMQHRRKCLHLECAVEEVDFLQDLVKRSKEADMFTPKWGKNARLSNASMFVTKPPEITNTSKYVLRHVNYHSSMIYYGMEELVGLDRQQPFYSVNNPLLLVGSMSLCHILYHNMKLAEGYYLIAEVHKESELDSVDIVVPEISKSEAMVAITNKQL